MTREERTALAGRRDLLEAWRACGDGPDPAAKAAE